MGHSLVTTMLRKVWFDVGKKEKFNYMIIVYDSYSYDFSPLYSTAKSSDEFNVFLFETNRIPSLQTVEVYNLNNDRNEQLKSAGFR